MKIDDLCLKIKIILFMFIWVLTAKAETNFNDCKAVRDSVARLDCLKQASDLFQSERDTFESFDTLTLKSFRLNTKPWAFKAALYVADGMQLEEPNNINSGQDFGTILMPSIGVL